MTRLLWLPDVLDRWLGPAGFRVETVPGWADRGDDFPDLPSVVIGHHTATPARVPGNMPTLRILRDGRPDLSGPLCQVGLGRDGTAYVVAAGKANHAGRGAWLGIKGWPADDVNQSWRTVGIEAEHPGDGSPWPALQLAAYDLVAAALLNGLGSAATSYCGHREWALPDGRKVDPRGINLAAQRIRIARLLAAPPGPTGSLVTPPAPAPPAPTVQEDDMAVIARGTGSKQFLTDLLTTKRWIRSTTSVTALKADGIRELMGAEYDGALASLPDGPDIP